MITTLQFDIQTAEQQQKLQMVLDYVSNIKLPFRKKDLEANDTDEEWAENEAIRHQLTIKYVVSGQWDTMSDDERQDAALLEKMLWQQEQPRIVYSVGESAQILADLKTELYGD